MAGRTVKIAVLGAPNVGKTAITVKYLTKRFIGEYSSRRDFLYKKYELINGIPTYLEILDTCKYSERLINDKLKWADAFLVVFSVVDATSLLLAERLLDALTCCKRPTLLLANKCDLEHSRVVGNRLGQEMAINNGCLYLEVSAAANSHDCSPSPAFLALARLCSIPDVQSQSYCFSARTIWRQIINRNSDKNRLQQTVTSRENVQKMLSGDSTLQCISSSTFRSCIECILTFLTKCKTKKFQKPEIFLIRNKSSLSLSTLNQLKKFIRPYLNLFHLKVRCYSFLQ